MISIGLKQTSNIENGTSLMHRKRKKETRER